MSKIDIAIDKLLSRKLLVFFIATFGLFSGFILSGDWVIIASTYIGVQGISDIVQTYKE